MNLRLTFFGREFLAGGARTKGDGVQCNDVRVQPRLPVEIVRENKQSGRSPPLDTRSGSKIEQHLHFERVPGAATDGGGNQEGKTDVDAVGSTKNVGGPGTVCGQ